VCKREKEREKERKNREKKKYFNIFLKKMNSRQKKIKKNALLAGHRAGVPCNPVSRVRI
jgi:hypothetical protein